MNRGQRRDEDWSEYQEYNTYSGRDPTEASTNSPALDTYLSKDEEYPSSGHPSRKPLPVSMLLAAGGVGVLLVFLLAVLIGRSTPSRTTAVNKPTQPSPQQVAPDKNANPSPDTPKPPAQPEANQDKNLVSQLSKGVVQVLTTKSPIVPVT